MLFQESVAIVFLDLVLVFFSNETCFTLNAVLIIETVIGILKISLQFMKLLCVNL